MNTSFLKANAEKSFTTINSIGKYNNLIVSDLLPLYLQQKPNVNLQNNKLITILDYMGLDNKNDIELKEIHDMGQGIIDAT